MLVAATPIIVRRPIHPPATDSRLPFDARFHALDAFLLQWQWLWREVPFKQHTLSWFARYPAWKQTIDAIDDAQLQQLAINADALYAFAQQALQFEIDSDFYRPGSISQKPASVTPPAAAAATAPDGIRWRKWQQIAAFGDALQADFPEGLPLPVVEWCAGKGHLSRTLLQRQLCTQATGLEQNQTLIDDGMAIGPGNPALTLRQQDVLNSDVAAYCKTASHHIALHACGKLHISMLQHCSANHVRHIDLVPCCYHLVDEHVHVPLSSCAQASTLTLDQEALKLALQETVTAPGNARRTREKLQQWRLGFDSLQRTLRDSNEYLPVPSFSGAIIQTSFREFCQQCAEVKHLTLPADVDYTRFEAQGVEQFARVSRYDLIRQLFRRPIELWLAYDRCLFLTERGYDVTLMEFCPRELTPRNLWIHASYSH